MIRVLSILPGGLAVVSTEGLRRVVTEAGQVIGELLPPDEAAAMVRGYNIVGDGVAKAVPYAEIEPPACEADATTAERILAELPGAVVVATAGLRRVRRTDNGESMGELKEAGLAEKMVEFFSDPSWGDPCEAVEYAAAK